MKISHHPSEELLLDYASGALGEAWSIAIATHLALCPDCRRTVSFMEDIGGGLLETVSPAPEKENSFDALLTKLDEDTEEGETLARPSRVSAEQPVLPQPLRGYLGCDVEGIRWERLGMGARQIIIPTGEKGVTVRLLHIPAGRPVPEHSHGGLELTLVLRGAFSDKTGLYGRGDLQEADAELQHQPHAAPGEDCICLAVTDAPLRFRSLAARLVQPWLNI